MKLVHLSDLHLGKRLHEASLLEDQEHILSAILGIIDDEQPDAVLIAGDVYDKSVPSAEAVQLFDRFLNRLAKREKPVFLISGNHDSPERLSFGRQLMAGSGIHIAPVYDGKITPVRLTDEFGAVDLYMLPFIKPVHVRKLFPDAQIESYTDALSVAVEQLQIDPDVRNVLVTHQFVTGAARSESEEISVGGTDNVDASVFDAFDYVALGHIHGPQNIGPHIRYCGTPLKYSFSEADQEKSVTVVQLGAKGTMDIRTVPLIPRLDLRQLRGTYNELTAKETYDGTPADDYLHITLTDEEDVPEAMSRLRVIYPNLLKLDYDNTRTRSACVLDGAEGVRQRSPLELFGEFYEKQNGQEMQEEQLSLMRELIEEIWEVGK